ncbi:MAG: hypothetical protein K8F90_20555 [Hyphomicrobiales bacterium]|nr:hypothetical protein [Hyphomicrobiales bacterium]
MADFPDSTILPEISRPVVEAEIERLINLLDTLDPDPDLESTGDQEPWLGAPNARTGSWFGSYGTDLWDDREEDTGDDEPWLGAANPDCRLHTTHMQLLLYRQRDPHLWDYPRIERTRETSQSSWCSNGCSDDREWDDEREPEDEGTSNYIGPCSPAETMFPQASQDLSR